MGEIVKLPIHSVEKRMALSKKNAAIHGEENNALIRV